MNRYAQLLPLAELDRLVAVMPGHQAQFVDSINRTTEARNPQDMLFLDVCAGDLCVSSLEVVVS